MILDLPYIPSHSVSWLESYFRKNFFKKPYDRFMWWRSYTPKNKPLHIRQPFRERLLNGDFDTPSFKFEAELVEHRLNDKWIEYGYADTGRWNEETSVDRARRKRLLEDFGKEEEKRLDELRRGFILEFKMTKEQYDEEVINTSSRNLIDFYYKMQDKYGLRRVQPMNPPGIKLAGDRNF